MAEILEGGCCVATIREGEPRIAGSMKIWDQIGRNVGAKAISLRTMEFANGRSPGLLNIECDEVMYVLEGVGTIFIEGAGYDVGPEMGVYIRPGQAVSIQNRSQEPVVIVSSRCPEPDAETEIAGAGPDGSDSSVATVLPLTGGPGMGAVSGGSGLLGRDPGLPGPRRDLSRNKVSPLVRLADRKALPTGDRWYRVLVDDEVGCTQVTQFIGSIPPGRAPDHFHLYEEVLVILSGEGRMWAGATNTPIQAGSCIYLPKSQIHCVENTGPRELRLLGVFYPAGSPAVRYDAVP